MKRTFLALIGGATMFAFGASQAPAEITVGKPAPKIDVKNQDDKTVQLKDYAGKWLVVYFYPRDDTPG